MEVFEALLLLIKMPDGLVEEFKQGPVFFFFPDGMGQDLREKQQDAAFADIEGNRRKGMVAFVFADAGDAPLRGGIHHHVQQRKRLKQSNPTGFLADAVHNIRLQAQFLGIYPGNNGRLAVFNKA